MKGKIKCSKCEGTGYVKKTRWTMKDYEYVHKMRKKGFTLRQILLLIGLDGNPQQIVHMLNQYQKLKNKKLICKPSKQFLPK